MFTLEVGLFEINQHIENMLNFLMKLPAVLVSMEVISHPITIKSDLAALLASKNPFSIFL